MPVWARATLAERALGNGLVESEQDVVERVRLVALDGEQIVGTTAEQIAGKRPLGEQGIGSGGAARDVGRHFEQADDGADPDWCASRLRRRSSAVRS